MGWGLGFDRRFDRYIGYGVPAFCDHPFCFEEIERSLSRVCCGEVPYGGEEGCGLYFCNHHSDWHGRCERCRYGEEPFTPKEEHPRWIKHLLTDDSWEDWRAENREKVSQLRSEYILYLGGGQCLTP